MLPMFYVCCLTWDELWGCCKRCHTEREGGKGCKWTRWHFVHLKLKKRRRIYTSALSRDRKIIYLFAVLPFLQLNDNKTFMQYLSVWAEVCYEITEWPKCICCSGCLPCCLMSGLAKVFLGILLCHYVWSAGLFQNVNDCVCPDISTLLIIIPIWCHLYN